MDNVTLTAIATGLLVIVGVAQIIILTGQKRQTSIVLLASYRNLWNETSKHWGNVIFIGRREGEYYQVLSQKELFILKQELNDSSNSFPTIWALESVRKVFNLLGEISTRILQGHLNVSDTYPILGTEFLRQSRPLRQLLDADYQHYFSNEEESKNHDLLRSEMQNWLSYHDGLRRRCLILIDVMWAEAVRMGDLPLDEAQAGATAKKVTGGKCRRRVFKEVLRMSNGFNLILAIKFYFFLKRAEYSSVFNWSGIRRKKYQF